MKQPSILAALRLLIGTVTGCQLAVNPVTETAQREVRTYPGSCSGMSRPR